MQIEHLNKETTDGTVRNLDALYQLFPSCFTEAQEIYDLIHEGKLPAHKAPKSGWRILPQDLEEV